MLKRKVCFNEIIYGETPKEMKAYSAVKPSIRADFVEIYVKKYLKVKGFDFSKPMTRVCDRVDGDYFEQNIPPHFEGKEG